eukprot:CAMPEP_0196153054 /NCGR_PEP_ID=MMETSP0910-20130528/36548_1 /TAXON_ID=49265 /ORGANISM="Thalassiosira rotula, Strain GSO102" /LENGTH=139 /DNA_ID=CAMNT_0041416781 /DNA_START=37 /DNA_END=456 /DNA_ORIENTATION=-
MTSAVPCRSTPASVDILEGQGTRIMQSIPSQPIPIKTCRPSAQELEEDAMSANSFTHYDYATWRMYDRITSARRLRAFTQSAHSVQQRPVVVMQDPYSIAREDALHRVDPDMINIAQRRQRQMSTADEPDDGVFVFDAL